MDKLKSHVIQGAVAVALTAGAHSLLYQPSQETVQDTQALQACIQANGADKLYQDIGLVRSLMFDSSYGLLDAKIAGDDLLIKHTNPFANEELVDTNTDGSVDGFSPFAQTSYARVVKELSSLCENTDKKAPIEARHCGEDHHKEIMLTGPSVVQLHGAESGNACSGFITTFGHLKEPVIVTASHCVFDPGRLDERALIATWPATMNSTTGEVTSLHVAPAVPIKMGYEDPDKSLTSRSSYDVSILGLPNTNVTRQAALPTKHMEPAFEGSYRMWGFPYETELASATLSQASKNPTDGTIRMFVTGDCIDGPGISGGPVVHNNQAIGLASATFIDGSYFFTPISAIEHLAANISQAEIDERTSILEEEGLTVQTQVVDSQTLVITDQGHIDTMINNYQ